MNFPKKNLNISKMKLKLGEKVESVPPPHKFPDIWLQHEQKPLDRVLAYQPSSLCSIHYPILC